MDDQNTVFDKSIVKEQKIFAKKSTVKHKVDSSIEEDISNKSDDTGQEGEILKVNVPAGVYFGEKFKIHKCSPKCVSKTKFDFNESEEKITGNVLLVPLQWGCRRQIVMHSYKGRRKVCYVTPCGRRLRNFEEVHKYLTITKLNMEMDFFSFEWRLRVLYEFKVAKEIQIKDIS